MIRKLSPELIREIAAGEVVTAPVDVLKELVENALDAGATRLKIELENGGISRIVVADNGKGMAKEDLLLSAEQHSTSKLSDLSAISSLGFRGEGLYAIRYAATLKLTSRPNHQLGAATLVAEGDTHSLLEHPAAEGTHAEVSDLFARLPARKAVLQHSNDELRKCTSLLGSYLLHYPALKLALSVDGEERWHYAGGSFLEAAKYIWGSVTANRLVVLNQTLDGYSFKGLISRPELSRPRRDRFLLAVNGRPIEWDESWIKHVLLAYKELLPKGQYPVGIVNVEMSPREVLVNTAPDKRRVRFINEAKVLACLQEALNATLAEHPLATPLPDLHQPSSHVLSQAQHSFPELSYLSSYRELYLLAEADGELWVIDGHAAHERILYEELSRRYKQEPPVELSHPELLPLSEEEVSIYLARQDELADKGLRLEPFGGVNWRVRTVPAFLLSHPSLVADVVKSSLGRNSAEDAWRAILGRLACLPALKAGHSLDKYSAQALLDALRSCQTPWACPHGRPTALVLAETDLARRFGRSGTRPKASKLLKQFSSQNG